MAQLNFNLDEDLLPIFNRLIEGGGQITPDTILLIQVLRKLDEQPDAGESPPRPDLGIDLVPTAEPLPPASVANPALQPAVDAIRGANQTLLSELNEQANPQPNPQPQQQPAAVQPQPATPQPVTPQPAPSRPAPPPPPPRPATR